MSEAATGIIKRPYAIIGAGNVGNALGRAIHIAGFRIAAVINKSHPDAVDLAKAVSADIVSTDIRSLPKEPCTIICAVPDNALVEVADALSTVPREWSGCIVMHTSGARASSVFQNLRKRGAGCASFHPLKSIPDGREAAVLADAIVAIEGDTIAVDVATSLARLLHMRPIAISEASKPAYHLGASIASNFVVTLFGMINEVLAAAGFSDLSAGELYGMLSQKTIDNIAALGPGAALTGPISRGDTETVKIHLQYLRANLPHLLPVYASLSTETVRTAVKAGKIDSDQARTVLDIVHNALLPSLGTDL
ncbi:MAG: DUF2520 domain-containing protein [Rhodothermales bacterium]|nr:DUF2520 domain-containing protein [Rhodothermales bacterium]